MVRVDVAQVGAQRPEGLGSWAEGVHLGQQGVGRGVAVEGDGTDSRQVGDPPNVGLGAHARVQDVPDQAKPQAEQRAEQGGQGQVEDGVGADRGGRQGGRAHDGCLDRAGAAVVHPLQLLDCIGDVLADSVGDGLRPGRHPVQHGDLDVAGQVQPIEEALDSFADEEGLGA